MLITCTNCATSYQVSAASLGPAGRSVRCARCQHTWFAANTEAMADVSQAHRADLAWIAETPAGADPAAPAAPATGFDWPEPPPQAEPASAAEGVTQSMGEGVDMPMPSEPHEAPASSEAAYAPALDHVSDAPPLAPTEPGPPNALPAGEDIESVAARRSQRLAAKRQRWQRTVWTSAILGLVALNLMLVGWRTEVVRLLPQTASLFAAIGLPVNLRGLIFSNVTTARESHEGVDVLVVEGTIVNDGKRAVEVPRLRFAVRNQMGHELYSWTALPNRNGLRPGETLPFRSHLASPPPDSDRIAVRFFNRRDLVAETP